METQRAGHAVVKILKKLSMIVELVKCEATSKDGSEAGATSTSGILTISQPIRPFDCERQKNPSGETVGDGAASAVDRPTRPSQYGPIGRLFPSCVS